MKSALDQWLETTKSVTQYSEHRGLLKEAVLLVEKLKETLEQYASYDSSESSLRLLGMPAKAVLTLDPKELK